MVDHNIIASMKSYAVHNNPSLAPTPAPVLVKNEKSQNSSNSSHQKTMTMMKRKMMMKKEIKPNNNKELLSAVTSEEWRQYGIRRRKQIVEEDQLDGYCSFHLSKKVPIRKYFQLMDRVSFC